MINLNMWLKIEDAELLRDTLISATDSGSDEFRYKSDQLEAMVDAVCIYIDRAIEERK